MTYGLFTLIVGMVLVFGGVLTDYSHPAEGWKYWLSLYTNGNKLPIEGGDRVRVTVERLPRKKAKGE